MNSNILACGACLAALAMATSASAVTDPFSILSTAANGYGTFSFNSPLSGIGEAVVSFTGSYAGSPITSIDPSSLVYSDFHYAGYDFMSQIGLDPFVFDTANGEYTISLIDIGLTEITGPGIAQSTAAMFKAGVPEPVTWALMLIGFGGLGAMARSRRKSLAVIA